MRNKTLLFIVWSMLAACGDEMRFSDGVPSNANNIEQSAIKVDYAVRYRVSERRHEASASFYLEPTVDSHKVLKLAGDSFVTFNDVRLEYVRAAFEHVTSADGDSTSGHFHYVNNHGDVFENDVAALAEVSLIDAPQLISRSKNTVLTWRGDANAENEGIEVEVIPEQEAAYTFTFANRTTDPNTIVIEPALLRDCPKGPATLVVRRTRETQASQANPVGARIKVTYEAAPVATLVE